MTYDNQRLIKDKISKLPNWRSFMEIFEKLGLIGAAANWTSPPLVLGLEGGLHVFSAESSPVFSKKLPRPKKTWLKCNRTRHSTTTQTPLIK
jgi:hypothetical protein